MSNSRNGSFGSNPNADAGVEVVVVVLDLCAIHWSQLKAPPVVVSSKKRTFHDEK